MQVPLDVTWDQRGHVPCLTGHPLCSGTFGQLGLLASSPGAFLYVLDAIGFSYSCLPPAARLAASASGVEHGQVSASLPGLQPVIQPGGPWCRPTSVGGGLGGLCYNDTTHIVQSAVLVPVANEDGGGGGQTGGYEFWVSRPRIALCRLWKCS